MCSCSYANLQPMSNTDLHLALSIPEGIVCIDPGSGLIRISISFAIHSPKSTWQESLLEPDLVHAIAFIWFQSPSIPFAVFLWAESALPNFGILFKHNCLTKRPRMFGLCSDCRQICVQPRHPASRLTAKRTKVALGLPPKKPQS